MGLVRPALWGAVRRVCLYGDATRTPAHPIRLSSDQSGVAGLVLMVGRAGLRSRIRECRLRDGASLSTKGLDPNPNGSIFQSQETLHGFQLGWRRGAFPER